MIAPKMRTEVVERKSYPSAKRRCPWAERISRINPESFLAFESREDYDAYRKWKKQK